MLKAKKIAQDELNASLAEQASVLETDTLELRKLETAVANGVTYEEAFTSSIKNASTAAKEHAIQTKGASGSTDVFVSKQRSAQASLRATATASKTASVAMRALSMAMNMIVIGLITKGLELLGSAISNYIHRVEKANEKIEESRSSYEDAKSSIESMNDELKTTQDKIDDLKSKGTLSFTDKAELDNLKAQNDELERSISLEEKKKQNAASQTVNDIKQNKDTLSDDFEESIKNLSEYQEEYEHMKQVGIKGISDETVTPENYEVTMTAMDKNMDLYEKHVLENIEKFEKYKEDIINKYNTDDVSQFSQSDRDLYNSIVSQLQKAYKTIYSDSDYNKFVIEPIFNQDKLKGLQDQLLQYFVNGGSTDTSALEEKFGADIITALRNACKKAGIDFDKMIEDMYSNSQSKLDQIAPMIETPNGAEDAKQNQVSKKIRDYIQNNLSEEDRTILLNAEIPDDIKFKTKQDVDNFIDSLNKEANETPISLSTTEAVSKINDLKSEFSDLDSIMASFISGDELDISNLDSVITKFQELKDAGKDIDMSSVENAIKQISDASTLDEAQSALDSLCQQYISASGIMNGLTEENKNLVAARLKAIGVANADEIVESELAAQKLATKVATEGLTEATLAEIQAYMDEKGYSEQAQQALYQLLLTKIDIANNPINTASDIQQLINLANAAGTASNYVEKLQRLLNMMNGINTYTKAATDINDAKKQQLDEQAYYRHAEKQGKKSNGKYETVDEYALAKANEYAQAIKNVTQTKLNANDFITKPHYGGGSSTRSAQNKANKSGGSGSKGGGSGSEKEPTKKDYDWIETLISRINRQVSNLGKTVSATYKTWSTRNNALAQELGSVNQQISAEQQAYNKYMQLANSVGLPEGYASLVRNGTIDVSTIADDDLNDKISKYQEYYNAALSASDAVQDLQDKLAELAKTRFDNVSAQFDSQIKTIEQTKGIYQSFIDQVETSGHQVSEKYYEYLISQEKNNINVLKNEFNSLSTAMGQAVADGRIQQGSEQWNDMYLSILDVQTAIEDANKSLLEYEKNLRQLKWDRFDKTEDYISKIQDESNFLVDLMSNQTLYDKDTGKDTKYATAIKGLHAVNYNAYMAQSDDYAKEIQEIDKEMAKDPYNTDLLERRQELLKAQQDAISNAEKEKQSIKSLVEDGIKAQLDALQKLIDKYKEALNSKKDLYDYQKSINEKTSNIASIQKQINAYGGDNSEETQSKIQQLQQNLKDVKSDLEDTEYQQYLSDQEQLLDTFYDWNIHYILVRYIPKGCNVSF